MTIDAVTGLFTPGTVVINEDAACQAVVLTVHPDRYTVLDTDGANREWTPGGLREVLLHDPAELLVLLRVAATKYADANARSIRQAQTIAEDQAKWDRLWTKANEVATENGWCPTYDQFAEEFDGPKRLRTYNVDVKAHLFIDSDEETANAAPIRRAVTGVLDRYRTSEVRVEVRWTHTFEIQVEGTYGNCCCEEIDDAMVEEALENQGVSYDELSDYDTCCPND